MSSKLTERRKADRMVMAQRIKALVDTYEGATCSIEEVDRAVWVHIQYKDARVGIDFDGDNPASLRDCYCYPWNIVHTSEARFSDAFGHAAGASVNPYHRRKCMGFAQGIDALDYRLCACLCCIERGEAFEAAPKQELAA